MVGPVAKSVLPVLPKFPSEHRVPLRHKKTASLLVDSRVHLTGPEQL
jgi:hypothetical protein